MPYRCLASTVTALMLLLAACATTAPPPPPTTGPIVTVTDIPPEADAVPLVEEPAPAAAEADAASADLIDGVDQPPTTSEALERAIAWTVEGLRHYDRGDHPAALRSLTDARIILLEAELPEAMQERGLMAIHGALPEDLRHHDLAALVAGLELELDGSGAELTEHAFVERQVRRILNRFDAAAPEERYLGVFVDEVTQYLRFYEGHHREFFARAFARKSRYWPMITAVFAAKGLPEELGYMALVESGFNPRAYSHAGARGLWQFIPATGRRYQLLRTDDFYDPAKATEAASEYLLDLIGIFGSRSFLLAMAAYNAGESRVQGCLRELDDPFGGRSFWEIRGCLARETREYVPRVIAAAVIGSDPRRFGFDEPIETLTAEALPPSPAEVTSAPSSPPATAMTYSVRRGDTLSGIAARHGVPYRELASWNGLSPPYRLQVGQTLAVRRGDGSPRLVYTVKQGNTLETIADVFAVRHSDIMSWNDLRSSRVQAGQRLVIHPTRPVRVETYQVRRGDTVAQIARRYGVPVRDVLTANGLDTQTLIRPGQRLTIYVA